MQVKNLQLQLKRFNRHEKLSEKLQKLEIELAQARISDLEKETKPLESFLKKKNKLLDKNSSKQKSENLDFSTAQYNY